MMRSIIPGLFFLALCLNGIAQSFQFIESTGTAAQSSYTRQAADTVGDEFILHCLNNSSAAKSVKVRMTVLSTPAGCSNDVFFCDPIACYPASVHLSVAPFGIAAGDTATGALVPHIDHGFCCGDYEVNYCLFDVSNESDSANVKVYYTVSGNHCTNGIGEQERDPFLGRAYPNPAHEKCRIGYNLPSQSVSPSLLLYDAAGRIINAYPLTGDTGELEIDTALLDGGIYFYALYVNGSATSFRKLISIK